MDIFGFWFLVVEDVWLCLLGTLHADLLPRIQAEDIPTVFELVVALVVNRRQHMFSFLFLFVNDDSRDRLFHFGCGLLYFRLLLEDEYFWNSILLLRPFFMVNYFYLRLLWFQLLYDGLFLLKTEVESNLSKWTSWGRLFLLSALENKRHLDWLLPIKHVRVLVLFHLPETFHVDDPCGSFFDLFSWSCLSNGTYLISLSLEIGIVKFIGSFGNRCLLGQGL